MTTIIANASSLVLLTKAEILEHLLKNVQLIIPRKVYEDADYKDIRKIESIYNIKAGERDMLALAQSLGISNILTDDKKAINVCKALNLRFTTALDILVQLRRGGIIDLEKAEDALNKLDEFGWYSRKLIKKAEGDIHAD